MGWNPVEIAQLKNAQAQRDADFQVQFGLRASREMGDQEIELALVPEAAEVLAFLPKRRRGNPEQRFHGAAGRKRSRRRQL